MLGILLESRAQRRRGEGGAAISIVVHAAILAAAVYATAHTTTARDPDVRVHVIDYLVPRRAVTTAPAAPAPAPAPARAVASASAPRLQPPAIVIPAPTSVPVGIPVVPGPGEYLAQALRNDAIGRGTGDHTTGGAAAWSASDADTGAWNASETMMRLIGPPRPPRYPESLRTSGVEGRVLVHFTIDTTGRVDAASLRIVQSSHELFTQAVRRALLEYRFQPARVNGRAVRAAAEMPFEFHMKR